MKDHKKNLLYITVFIAGISTMGIELTASRLIAPFFGASLYVWTNIIGIVLISLSIGYFLGGRFADKYPDEKYFYTFSLISGILIGLIPLISSFILPFSIQSIFNSSSNDFFLSLISCILLFSFPTIFLGAIVPFAVKINSENIEELGKTSGKIYGISTVGSIIGVYLPSLLLIPMLGTRFTILFFSMILIIVSTICLIFKLKINIIRKTFSIMLVIVFMLIITSFVTYPTPSDIAKQNNFIKDEIIYESETPYTYILVTKSETNMYLRGKVTGGIWSLKKDEKKFTNGIYDYPLICASMNNDTENILILGLGGGSTSNSFTYAYPDIKIDGVEIDPCVIYLGKRYFNMTTKNLNIITLDARLYVKITEEKYDIVIIDVYRDAYIPTHMVTTEFFEQIKAVLKEDGVICINIIYFNQEFYNAMGNTVSQVFPSVYIFKPSFSENYLLFATNQKTYIEEIKQSILNARENIPFSDSVSSNEKIELKLIFTDVYYNIEEYKASDEFMFFTDDKAPIENIIGMDVFSGLNR